VTENESPYSGSRREPLPAAASGTSDDPAGTA
jgi:hypothetical protein